MLSSLHADMPAQTCGHLERQAADLEATAHPALDALTRVVTTATLERVCIRIRIHLARPLHVLCTAEKGFPHCGPNCRARMLEVCGRRAPR